MQRRNAVRGFDHSPRTHQKILRLHPGSGKAEVDTEAVAAEGEALVEELLDRSRIFTVS